MSVAEKLKSRLYPVYDVKSLTIAERAAVVAVVKAAEGERSPHHADYWEREKDCPLCAALAALDETLS